MTKTRSARAITACQRHRRQRLRAWSTIHWSSLGRLAFDAWRATNAGPSGLAVRQHERLNELVSYARRHSPYFQALYEGLPESPVSLNWLPVTSKATLMDHFDAWVTDPRIRLVEVTSFLSGVSNAGKLYLGQYVLWTTSGTTGVPAVLVQDMPSLTVLAIIGSIRVPLGGFDPRVAGKLLRGHGRVAALFATGGHFAAAGLAEWVRTSAPYASRQFRLLAVQSPLPDLVAQLQRFQPAVIFAYASVLDLLASEEQAGRLHLRSAALFSTAETLSPAKQRTIEAVFECPLVDIYAASEAPGMAFSCRFGRLHINSDWYIVEPVDTGYRPVPVGKISDTVLITNLANYVQPVIRYDLGDRITVLADRCACGSALPVVRVEGRTPDLLTFTSEDGNTVRLLPLGLGGVIETTPGVGRFQAIQSGPSELAVRLSVRPGASDARIWVDVQENVRRYLARQGLQNVRTVRAAASPQRDPRTGKFRQVWSEIDEQTASPE